jgi:hypothetical protein
MATQFTTKVINKAQTERPWVNKIDANHYRCAARTLRDAKDKNRQHGKYVLEVSFDEDGLPVIEDCRDERTKEVCKGFYFEGYCFHGAAVSIHVLRPALRKAA